MSYWLRIGAFVAVSIVGHALFARAVTHLPERPSLPRLITVAVKLLQPQTPEPPPEPPKPEPEPRPLPADPRRQPIHEAPRKLAAAPADAPRDRVPRDVPPTERPALTGDSTGEPVFGLSMESTSAHGTGAVVPVGNTLQTKHQGPAAKPGAVKPLAAPVQAYEVTKMPLPRGRCSGEYTDAAKAAGVEGTVVLDLVVGADGVPREITVVKGLPHGLTEAAIATLGKCRFTPGERDGAPVPVRLRGFKIRFVLQAND
jgi:periplasmic protein TonB